MGYIDLHVHSTASDGSYSPADLVRLACEKGLYAFALTDHDTVAGINAAIAASRTYPVHVIPGVELSSSLGGREIHILGYHIDHNDPRFIQTLKVIAQSREDVGVIVQAVILGCDIDVHIRMCL